MSGPHFWVVGRGGLLGAEIERAVLQLLPRARRFQPPVAHFAWSEQALLQEQLADAAGWFGRAIREGAPAGWLLFWTAGAGVVGTSASAFACELNAFECFLDALRIASAGDGGNGIVFLASSAGGIHGGSGPDAIDEATPPAPISDYGRAKLAQEEALRVFARRRPDLRCFIGRISNLYGQRQKLGKLQGFISQLSRCAILDIPAEVYVPLDTIRDFLYVDDCAQLIVRCAEHLLRAPAPPDPVLKILASEQPASLAQVIGHLERATRRRVKIVTPRRPGSALQPTNLHFRSGVLRDVPVPRLTDLAVGIHRVHEYQSMLFRAGRLPRLER